MDCYSAQTYHYSDKKNCFSCSGTLLGIGGSTINNRLKMAEFKDLMEQQMARSASVLYTIAGGGSASRADIAEAMKTEFAYQVILQMIYVL